MAPYSLDLRQKVVQAYERGVGSQRQIAELFGVSLSFVEKLFMQLRRTGNLAPKPHAGGKTSRLDANVRLHLENWLQDQPDLTLAELAGRLDQTLGLRVGTPQLCRLLQAMGLSRKKSHSTPRSATGRR
jgi:transposase